MDGRCQCGAVRFKTPLDAPLKIYVCHCRECQLQAASSYGLTAVFPQFDLPGDAMKHVRSWSRFVESGEMKCLFCQHCGTRLIHRCDGQKYLSVKAGTLEGVTRDMMDKAVHIWTKRAITPIPAGAEQYDEEPPSVSGEEV